MRITSFEHIPHKEFPKFDLKITIKPTMRCNQKCWYCGEYDNNEKDMTLDEVQRTLDFIKDIEKEKIWIYFYGGEPTLNKHWEYMNYELVKHYDTDVFIQTQTNLSIDKKRLLTFCKEIERIRKDNVTVDICSSYHLKKQSIEDFLEKMDILNDYDMLGFCFFNTDMEYEDMFIDEFNRMSEKYPFKTKIRFTERQDSAELKSLDYRYFMRKYPWISLYEEEGFSFKINDEKVMGFAEVSGNNVHYFFKMMICECGKRNIVIDNRGYLYHCNDEYYYYWKKPNNRPNIFKGDVDVDKFLEREVMCRYDCHDGLEFRKYRN